MNKCVVKHELGYVVLLAREICKHQGSVEEEVLWEISFTDVKDDATVFRSFDEFLWLSPDDTTKYYEENL